MQNWKQWELKRSGTWMLFGLPDDCYSWRGVGLLVGVYLGAMGFAAVLSPLIFDVARWWLEFHPGWWNNWLDGRTDVSDFPRYFDRLRWLPVVVGFPFLLKACGLLSWRALGFQVSTFHLILLLRTFILGCGIASAVIATQLVFATVTIDARFAYGWEFSLPLRILLGALTVSLLEEIVFRGFVFRIFYTAVRPWPAILISSLFFAWTHYKYPRGLWSDEFIEWHSGFEVAWGSLTGITYGFAWFPFLTLVLLGVTLNLLLLRTGSLLACIGFHTGVVFVRLLYDLTHNTPLGEHAFILGTASLNDGLLTVLLLAGTVFWFSRQTCRDHTCRA